MIFLRYLFLVKITLHFYRAKGQQINEIVLKKPNSKSEFYIKKTKNMETRTSSTTKATN